MPYHRPCRTITFAIGPTDDGGEIHVIGPISHENVIIGGIGPSFSVIAEGHAVFSHNPAGGDYVVAVGIAASDEVTVRGVHIDQRGGDARGIWFPNAGALHIEDCVIWNGENGYAIEFAPTGAAELYISNCVIRDSGAGSNGGGILIRPTGSGSAKVVLNDVRIENNRAGIILDGAGSTGGITMSMTDSTIIGSTGLGLGVFEAVSGGSPSAVTLERTTISSNGSQGIFASRALASVRVRQSAITGNAVGVGTANGGQIISHGDNVLAGNTTNGAFTATVAPQ